MHYASRAQLQAIASRFQHLAIDETTHGIGVEATHDELMALRRDGIDATIDDAATLRLRKAEAYWRAKAAGATLIDGFPCYRTVAETYATMDQLAQSNPMLAQVVDIGPSWSENRAPGTGHRMRALELTNRATGSVDTTTIDIDPEAMTVGDLVSQLDAIGHVAASLSNGRASSCLPAEGGQHHTEPRSLRSHQSSTRRLSCDPRSAIRDPRSRLRVSFAGHVRKPSSAGAAGAPHGGSSS